LIRPSAADAAGRRWGWKAGSAYLAGFLVVVMPVAAINTAVSNPRELLGTTWQLGPNFYIGNGPEATGTYVAPPFVRGHPAYEAGDYAAEAMRRAGRPLAPGQVSRFWLVEGLKHWANAPMASLRLLSWKLALVTHWAEIPDNQDIEFVRIVAAPALGWGTLGFGVVFPLAVVGLGRVPRTRFWWFLVLSTTLGFLATSLFFVVGRYRLPWSPGLILLASAGVVDLVRLARLGDWRGLAWRAGALGLPAALVCWRPQADAAPSRWGNQLLAMGVAELRAGRADHGIDALDLARATGPATAAGIRQQSIAGPLRELLREAIEPERLGEPDVRERLSREVARARRLRQIPERIGQARSLLASYRKARPDDRAAMREWGALLLAWPERPDDRDRAVAVLKRAARGPGGDPRAALMASVADSDPDLLRIAEAVGDREIRRLASLVRAILASRPTEAVGRGGFAGSSPRRSGMIGGPLDNPRGPPGR
jgi:hypothetical protein